MAKIRKKNDKGNAKNALKIQSVLYRTTMDPIGATPLQDDKIQSLPPQSEPASDLKPHR